MRLFGCFHYMLQIDTTQYRKVLQIQKITTEVFPEDILVLNTPWTHYHPFFHFVAEESDDYGSWFVSRVPGGGFRGKRTVCCLDVELRSGRKFESTVDDPSTPSGTLYSLIFSRLDLPSWLSSLFSC